MSKLQNMRVVEIPSFRAVSSGTQTLDELFGPKSPFSAWVDSHKGLLKTHIFEPQDFLWHENKNIDTSVWVLAVNDTVTAEDTAPYETSSSSGTAETVSSCAGSAGRCVMYCLRNARLSSVVPRVTVSVPKRVSSDASARNSVCIAPLAA